MRTCIRQPIYPRINANSPYAKSLVMAYCPTDITSCDLVSRNNMRWYTNTIEPSSPVIMSNGKVGRAILSTHDYARFDTEYNPIAATDSVTICAWAKDLVGAGDQHGRTFFARGKDGNGNGWSLSLGSDASSLKRAIFGVVWTSPSLVGRVLNSFVPLTTGRWIIGRYTQGVSLSMFFEGAEPVHDTTSVGTSLRTSTLGLGFHGGVANGFNDYSLLSWYGLLGDVFVWNRALSDKECLGFLDNPFQIYQEREFLYTGNGSGNYTPLIVSETGGNNPDPKDCFLSP